MTDIKLLASLPRIIKFPLVAKQEGLLLLVIPVHYSVLFRPEYK